MGKQKKRATQTGEIDDSVTASNLQTNYFDEQDYGNTYRDDFDDGMDSSNLKSKWYDEFADDPTDFTNLPDVKIYDLKFLAQKYHEAEVTKYNSKKTKQQSDYQWMRTIMSKGTVSDKIAAYTVLIQDSPVHNISILRNLVNMAKVSKKKECLMVIDTLTELFTSDLLIPGRKLRPFAKCPLSLLDELSSGNQKTKQARLVHWYFEDQLKQLYHIFVSALNTASHDSVDANKEKAISAMHKLLVGNPELESVLLIHLVNKLGDPSQKVAAKVIYCLGQVLHHHPNMKMVMMEEIEKLLFRPNISHRAQYYGICFLAQFLFSYDDALLARNMIHLYFSFFKACVKKGEVDSRMMSALLMGVNRAFPFAKHELVQIQEHMETLYKVVHLSSFNVSIQTLCLLFQVSSCTMTIADRFYSALYKKILDPCLATSKHHAMFLSLVFRALKSDQSIPRVRAFVKRLLQVCEYLPVPLVCGILFLISQLLHVKHELSPIVMESNYFEEDGDDDCEHYNDIKLQESETAQYSEDKSNTERDPIENSMNLEEVHQEIPLKPVATWFHLQNQSKGKQPQGVCKKYDPQQRNPVFAGGEHCVFLELVHLAEHFHPTVSLFAQSIIYGEVIDYSGDPLQDFTLARFLDRFVFKNPKKPSTVKDDIYKQFDRKKNYEAKGAKAIAVDSLAYISQARHQIPEDELFMYKYLHKKRKEGMKMNDELPDDGSDVESVASEEFEELMEKFMGKDSEELDFANDVTNQVVTKKRKRSNTESDEDDNIESEEHEGSDEDDNTKFVANGEKNINHSSDDESMLESDADMSLEDDEEEDLVFDDDNDDDDDDGDNKLNFNKKSKKKYASTNSDIFASAEEFAEILQDIGASGLKAASSGTVNSKDKAGKKQLRWESDRDFWINKSQKSVEKSSGGKTKFSKHFTGKNKGGKSSKLQRRWK